MKRNITLTIAALCCLSLLVSGCATTRQARSVQQSGFLGDYSMLRKGKDDEAALVYINKNAEIAQYNALMIDSVTFWYKSDAKRLSPEDEQALTGRLYSALKTELEKDYAIVDRPGPGVLRLRAAITQAKGANVAGNAVTTIVPQFRLLASLGGMATDAAVLVGKAAVEAEITDSLTGERLLAGVDERMGNKTLRALGKWSQVDDAFDYWAERVRTRLAELREG